MNALRGRWRTAAALLAVGLLGWIAAGVIRAGSDVPPPNAGGQTRLSRGQVSGTRIDGRSWSLDYTSMTMSPDGSIADVRGVRDGRLLSHGRPVWAISAEEVQLNQTTGDFSTVGPVTLRELGGRHRVLRSSDVRFMGALKTLALDRPTTVTTPDGTTVTVAHASFNFRTHASTLGRIEATGREPRL